MAAEEIQDVIERTKALDTALGAIEDELDDSAPRTPGRVPELS